MGLKMPGVKQFYLLGDEHNSKREVDIGLPRDLDDLKHGIATEYTIVKPEGLLSLVSHPLSSTDMRRSRCWFPDSHRPSRNT
jgi:hypothetical protein